MAFVTPSPVSIGVSELELDMLEDWDFKRGNLDGIMRKAVELEQGRREQQRQRMVLYRRKKKATLIALRQERQRLEAVLQERVARVREVADSMNTITIRTTRAMEEAVHHVSIERAMLAREYLALRRAVDDCQKRRKTIEHNYEAFRRARDDPLPSDAVPLQSDEGWYVHFPNNSPSFFYRPLSRQELDNVKALNVSPSSCVTTVGNIFGWTVDYAPVTRNETDTAFMAHARFSRRLRCTLDDAATVLLGTDMNAWPVVVAARSWGIAQSGRH